MNSVPLLTVLRQRGLCRLHGDEFFGVITNRSQSKWKTEIHRLRCADFSMGTEPGILRIARRPVALSFRHFVGTVYFAASFQLRARESGLWIHFECRESLRSRRGGDGGWLRLSQCGLCGLGWGRIGSCQSDAHGMRTAAPSKRPARRSARAWFA